MNYLHAILEELDVGTILKPRDDYKDHWGDTDFYLFLEKYRPLNMKPHHESVFMCTSIDDLDNCMEGIYLFEVKPLGLIQRHDMNWSTEISCLVGDGADETKIKQAAQSYWNGIPHSNREPLWEYLTSSAEILKVYPYDEYEDKPVKKLKM